MLQSVMKDYLNEQKKTTCDVFGLVIESVNNDIPLEVKQSEWAVSPDPERLVRQYKFSDVKIRNWFLRELLEEEHNTGHFGKIVISGLNIIVEVWTHDVDAVTELDIEYAQRCDDIYGDVGLLGEFGYEY